MEFAKQKNIIQDGIRQTIQNISRMEFAKQLKKYLLGEIRYTIKIFSGWNSQELKNVPTIIPIS
jgi:hypothetical protein